MKKMCEVDRARLLRYLSRELECNLFIIGDIENFGFDSPEVEVFAEEDGSGSFNCVALRFFANLVIYSASPHFDARALAELVAALKIDIISGKGETCRALYPYLEGYSLRETHLAGCREPREFPLAAEGFELRRVGPEQAEALIALFCEIDEFRDSYIEGEQRARRTEEKRAELERGSEICYCVFEGETLVSTAAVAADCSLGGMVVGVATRKEYRGRGLASAAVSAVCRDRIAAGRETLAIFYDNPEAAKIYKKVGFEELGEYVMLKPIARDGKIE